jgi:hypothetical protein
MDHKEINRRTRNIKSNIDAIRKYLEKQQPVLTLDLKYFNDVCYHLEEIKTIYTRNNDQLTGQVRLF